MTLAEAGRGADALRVAEENAQAHPHDYEAWAGLAEVHRALGNEEAAEAALHRAVDAAVPGDLVLVSPGVYEEAVTVTTDDIVIRGLDRNEVILDGEFELVNAIEVHADGVAVENMTARNYTGNGFYWTGIDRYRGSYLTAHSIGIYGIYAFGSTTGLFEKSYASGTADAGFYIGNIMEPREYVVNNNTANNGGGYGFFAGMRIPGKGNHATGNAITDCRRVRCVG